MPQHPLADHIRAIIETEGPITFARYMALALYDSAAGYYSGGATGREPVGWAGDFFTSGDISPLWGWAIAKQLDTMWRQMSMPTPFDVVEPGGGRGLLARDVWRHAPPDLARALRYTIIESAPAENELLRARASRLAADLAAVGIAPERVRWRSEDALREPITGCILSNELYDALPCHRVLRDGATLREVYIGVAREGSRLIELAGPPSTRRISAYLARYAVDWRALPNGWRGEVCLAAEQAMRGWARRLARGYLLTVDYGATAHELYSAERLKGTLGVYADHRFSDDPLRAPGEQDITAHVNFSALMRVGEQAGART
ncbi:MAG TPA: SAM-dependent methyltransferase, partial [Ktedonobacterales bacterium]